MVELEDRRPDEHDPNLSVIVRRSSGERTGATMTRLWYDGCELASRETFEPGEAIEVAMGRMGQIRARVKGTENGTILVRFDEECPV